VRGLHVLGNHSGAHEPSFNCIACAECVEKESDTPINNKNIFFDFIIFPPLAFLPIHSNYLKNKYFLISHSEPQAQPIPKGYGGQGVEINDNLCPSYAISFNLTIARATLKKQ
jgi:hypothetical protein